MVTGMTRSILQICPHDIPPFDTLCQNYTQAFERLNSGVTTIILGEPEQKSVAEFVYLEQQDLSNTKALKTVLQRYLDENIAQAEADLVLCHRYRAYRTALAAGISGKRMVVVAHEYGMFHSKLRRLHRYVAGSDVRLAGVSQPVADELAERRSPSLVLPNVVDTSCDRLSREEARRQLQLPLNEPVIGVVGRLHYKKRPDLVIDTFKSLQGVVEPAVQPQLIFMGDGPARQNLQIAKQTVAGIHLPGNVARAADFLPALDVLLHCGDVEAFGMVILEAMAAGVPVVVGPREKMSGPAFVLDDLGWYAKADTASAYAEAIQRCLHANDKRINAHALRARAEQHFSIPSLADKLSELLESVQE